MEEKIQLIHPQGKHMPRMSISKYDQIRDAFIKLLEEKESVTHNELMSELESRLSGKFEGNIPWHAEGVKLDLEARGIIERTNDKPQRYKLK